MPGYWPTRLRDGWEYCFHLSKTKKPYINQDVERVPIGEVDPNLPACCKAWLDAN